MRDCLTGTMLGEPFIVQYQPFEITASEYVTKVISSLQATLYNPFVKRRHECKLTRDIVEGYLLLNDLPEYYEVQFEQIDIDFHKGLPKDYEEQRLLI